jgi:hypothetical protein
MQRGRHIGDIIGGFVHVALGLWFMQHALSEYNFGSMLRMGPGFFPVVLGALVAGFGVLILIPALFRSGDAPVPDWRPFAFVCAALIGFALTLERFGLVPATFVLVFLASAGQPGARMVPTLAIAIVLSVISVVVFTMGLGIPIPAFRWSP